MITVYRTQWYQTEINNISNFLYVEYTPYYDSYILYNIPVSDYILSYSQYSLTPENTKFTSSEPNHIDRIYNYPMNPNVHDIIPIYANLKYKPNILYRSTLPLYRQFTNEYLKVKKERYLFFFEKVEKKFIFQDIPVLKTNTNFDSQYEFLIAKYITFSDQLLEISVDKTKLVNNNIPLPSYNAEWLATFDIKIGKIPKYKVELSVSSNKVNFANNEKELNKILLPTNLVEIYFDQYDSGYHPDFPKEFIKTYRKNIVENKLKEEISNGKIFNPIFEIKKIKHDLPDSPNNQIHRKYNYIFNYIGFDGVLKEVKEHDLKNQNAVADFLNLKYNQFNLQTFEAANVKSEFLKIKYYPSIFIFNIENLNNQSFLSKMFSFFKSSLNIFKKKPTQNIKHEFQYIKNKRYRYEEPEILIKPDAKQNPHELLEDIEKKTHNVPIFNPIKKEYSSGDFDKQSRITELEKLNKNPKLNKELIDAILKPRLVPKKEQIKKEPVKKEQKKTQPKILTNYVMPANISNLLNDKYRKTKAIADTFLDDKNHDADVLHNTIKNLYQYNIELNDELTRNKNKPNFDEQITRTIEQIDYYIPVLHDILKRINSTKTSKPSVVIEGLTRELELIQLDYSLNHTNIKYKNSKKYFTDLLDKLKKVIDETNKNLKNNKNDNEINLLESIKKHANKFTIEINKILKQDKFKYVINPLYNKLIMEAKLLMESNDSDLVRLQNIHNEIYLMLKDDNKSKDYHIDKLSSGEKIDIQAHADDIIDFIKINEKSLNQQKQKEIILSDKNQTQKSPTSTTNQYPYDKTGVSELEKKIESFEETYYDKVRNESNMYSIKFYDDMLEDIRKIIKTINDYNNNVKGDLNNNVLELSNKAKRLLDTIKIDKDQYIDFKIPDDIIPYITGAKKIIAQKNIEKSDLDRLSEIIDTLITESKKYQPNDNEPDNITKSKIYSDLLAYIADMVEFVEIFKKQSS